MSDTKIFSIPDGNGGNSMAPLIASLCQSQRLDPNAVFAMMNNNRGNGGWGDMGAWWIIILLIFGYGRYGMRDDEDYDRMGERYPRERWEEYPPYMGERRGRSPYTGRYVRR